MVHFFAVRQAKALLGVDILRFHLQHFDHINGALQILVLGDALIRELPAGEKRLHHQIFDRDLGFHIHSLIPVCLR